MKVRQTYSDEQLEIVDQRIARTCHPKQRDFVFDPGRRLSALVGRGGGKTAGALLRMIRRMARHPGANCLFIAATRESAERLVWQDLKRIVGLSLRLDGVRFNESKLICSFPNGSQLMLFGCDDKRDINKLRGITYHEVVVDEVASINKELLRELLQEVIGPRLVGTLSLIGTPGKELSGLFYEASRPGGSENRAWADRDLPEFSDWKKFSAHKWNIKDGVAHGIEAMIEIYAAQCEEIESQGLSENSPRRRREFDGEWATDDSTHVYIYREDINSWDPKRDANGFAILPEQFKDWAYAIGVDVGFKDAFALEVFAFSYSDPTRTLYHVFEIYRTRLYANAIAKLLIGEQLNHERYEGIFGAIGYPDVMVGDFAGAGGALLLELKDVYGIVIKPADKAYKYKENSIELANSMLFEGQVKIMKGSHLAQEMTSLEWDVDQWGKRIERKSQANHGTDAFIYLRDAVAPLLPSAGAKVDAPKKSLDDDDFIVPREPEYGNSDTMYEAMDY